MEVDYLVLADAASVADGKHYIHGAGWDSLFAASFPVTHPLMAVAVRLRVPWNAANQVHGIELDVLDEDGNSVLPEPPGPLRGEVNVGRPPHIRPGTHQYICLALNIVGLQFHHPGEYVVRVGIDETTAHRTTFRVSPPPGMPAQPAQ